MSSPRLPTFSWASHANEATVAAFFAKTTGSSSPMVIEASLPLNSIVISSPSSLPWIESASNDTTETALPL